MKTKTTEKGKGRKGKDRFVAQIELPKGSV